MLHKFNGLPGRKEKTIPDLLACLADSSKTSTIIFWILYLLLINRCDNLFSDLMILVRLLRVVRRVGTNMMTK